jgi:MFS family permease
MAVSGFDIGYTIQINAKTLSLILGDLFPIENTELAKHGLEFAFFLGCVVGCVWGGKHVSYGRRRALIFSALFMIGISLLMMIQNYYVFLCGRVLMGFSIGIKIVASLRMVEEYSP